MTIPLSALFVKMDDFLRWLLLQGNNVDRNEAECVTAACGANRVV